MGERIKVKQKLTQDSLDESNKRQLEQTNSTNAIMTGWLDFVKTSSTTSMSESEK